MPDESEARRKNAMLYYWNIGQMYTDCDVRRKWERTVCHVLAGKIG